MNEDDLRAARPPERRLPSDRRTTIKETLMASITDEEAIAAHVPRRKARRRLAVTALGFVVLGAGTAAAAAVGVFDRPDPVHVDTVIQDVGEPASSAHLDGWRPELAAEDVVCALSRDGEVSVLSITSASEFPIGDPIDEAEFARECAVGIDATRDRGLDVADANVCVDDGSVRPVVLVDGTQCGEVGLEPMTASHLAAINERRSVEVAMLAVPSESGCPTPAQAIAWVAGQVEQSSLLLSVATGEPGTHTGPPTSTTTTVLASASPESQSGELCYRGKVNWETNTVTIEATITIDSTVTGAPGP